MVTKTIDPNLVEENTDEFLRLADRLGWYTAGAAAAVLGRNRRTVVRWMKRQQNVERSDIAFMQEIERFLDDVPANLQGAAGSMDPDDFVETVLALGWNIAYNPPSFLANREGYQWTRFCDVADIEQRVVRSLAHGVIPIPIGVQLGLERLRAQLSEPPLLAARLHAGGQKAQTHVAA